MAVWDKERKVLDLKSGGQLDKWQVEGICSGPGGSAATTEQIREYLTDEGWLEEEITDFLLWVEEIRR